MSGWSYAQIRSLSGRLGFYDGSLEFLAYRVELESGRVFDTLTRRYVEKARTLYILLSHYAKANPVEEVGRLIRYRDLPGGYAYDGAFTKRAVLPVAETFGHEPKMLVRAAKALNGIETTYGDSSVTIPVLPKISLTYILWEGDREMPPASSILFDASASTYLPTEDLAVLGEITTTRLKSSKEK